MDKRRPDIEILPVLAGNNFPHKSRHQTIYSKRMQRFPARIPYISDPTLIPRVQKYVESSGAKGFIDVNTMANDLQQTYRDYAKRKRSAFRASVKKAYSVLLYGLDQDNQSTDDEDLSDDSRDRDDDRDRRFDNSMQNQMIELYKRPEQNAPKKIDENELIDISSDSDNSKSGNGPSTSNKNYEISLETLPFERYGNKDGYQSDEYQTRSNDRGKKRKLEASSPAKSNLKKKKTASGDLGKSSVTFKDVGGMNKVLEDICKLLIHIKHPELYLKIGISPPRGFLLHGPPGCGKTLLANAIAGELRLPLLKVAAPELVAGVSGESEERIRELFERALNSAPCVLFIDEIDAITQNRQNAQKEMERRIVAQILSCLDDLSNNINGNSVLVIGATNRPDSIDPALRRAGRFDREICVGIPDLTSRVHILKVLTAKLKLSSDFDFESLAQYTPGFVGADLLSLTREAAMAAVNRTINELKEKRKLKQSEAKISKPPLVPQKPELEETSKDNGSSESNKSDTEIIVDDDVSSKEPQVQPQEAVNGSADSVVVIDVVDDESGKLPEVVDVVDVADDDAPAKETPTARGEPSETSNGPSESVRSPPELMPVDTVVKTLTPLEELLFWLHEKSPVSDSQLEGLCVTMEDFAKSLKVVQPSAKREGFATVPDTTWDDIGSLKDIREELQMAILAPVRHAEQFQQLGLNVPAGILLCGPPGCGKTLLAKAIANEAGINFISVKGPELLNMYVGESERAVRVCFERARNSAPCVIFFDELDALCPKRSDSRDGGPTMRVVNQMLTEMDGVEGRKGVFLLAASNRPDIIDPAVLRPGRLDKILYVGLPSESDRVDILRALTKAGSQPCMAPDVSLDVIGRNEKCRGFTGADLSSLVREAGVNAIKQTMISGDTSQRIVVKNDDFEQAFNKIKPSVTEKDQRHYEKLKKMYAVSNSLAEVEEMEYS